jgi:hypothetical protein
MAGSRGLGRTVSVDEKSFSGLGTGIGREAGFSAALLTMRPRAASVEMTIFVE